ncbi:ABC transporter substrate binding protein [Fundidesulfovibrio soli]|uniref:ABC transporter substrate binding protein n=1 Tax=Fundidesulfovibrio soli TaxID=2922716 RepID=UPI001FAF284F|nr:ABC transporter substrate binding protein [Fundidesulfovibrio soli]
MKSLLLNVLFLLAFGCGLAHAQADSAKKRILYFNSYHSGYAWSDQVLVGIRSALDKSGQPYDLLIEFMDTKRFVTSDVGDILERLYRDKYAGITPDVIIASDDYAFQFLLERQDRLFPGVPVIFCGVNDFDPAMIASRRNMTGVVENPDFKANFKLLRELLPDVRRVIVVTDYSLTGQAIQKQLMRAASEFKTDFTLECITVRTLNEVLEETKNLTERDMVYLVPIYLHDDGQVYSVEDVCDILSAKLPVAINSAWQFMLGHGIIGGKLHSGEGEGVLAANMALQVLAGEPTAKIKVVDTFSDPFMFDYKALKRFGIPQIKLPFGSTLINEPLSFYTINKHIVWFGLAGFFFLVFILVLLVTSILQKRSVELQIKNQLSFLRILMDTIPLPLSYKGVDGRYLGCNLAFEKWFGVERDLLLGNPVHPLATRFDSAERNLLARPGVISFETDMLDAAGSPHGVIVSKATYLDAKGEIAGVVEAIQDITLRREAEKALRQSQTMLQTVLNNIPQLVYWKDRNLNFIGVNRSFLDFFGLEGPEQIVGSRLNRLLPEDEAKASEEINRRVLASGHSIHRREWILHLPGREPVVLEMTIVPLYDGAGNVVGILGTAEDVTAKMSLEKQLLQSQKMEAIGALAGGIAHDFNNILTSIINSTELALMDISDESDTALDLERTLKAARRGARLVKQILSFSRPTQEGFTATDVAEVVHEALAIFAATLPRSISLNERIEVHPAMAFADPTQLHQIVMNLCANAFQAMRETGGHMSIELDETDFDEVGAEVFSIQPGRYLRISVTDNGPGIPPEIMDRIFDPFFTTKAKGEGTGLGLAVVHGIVKSHRGALKVSSQPGQRTSFEIFLPKLEEVSRAKIALPLAAPMRQGHEHVLFVEDDEDQLKVIPRVLELMGYTVTAKSRAQEALDYLAISAADVEIVVTDFDMPAISGVEFAGRLGKLHPHLPVILVSGRRSALTAAERAGNIRTVLLKPYNGEDLGRAIGHILDAGRS